MWQENFESKELLESKLRQQAAEDAEGQQTPRVGRTEDGQEPPPQREAKESKDEGGIQKLSDAIKGAFEIFKHVSRGEAATKVSSKCRIIKALMTRCANLEVPSHGSCSTG